MRTDAKIGFAIGGVLLAVLAAYLLVVGPKHNTKKTVALAPKADVTPVAPPTADTAVTTSNTATSIPPTVAANDPGSIVTPPPQPFTPPGIDEHKSVVLTDIHNPAVDGVVVDGNSKLFHPSEPKPIDTGDGMTDGMIAQNNSNNVVGGTDSLPAVPKTPSDKPKTGSHRTSNRHGSDHTVTAERTTVAAGVATGTASAPRQYTVRSGQTLSGIAADVYGNARYWVAIQRANAGLDAKHLKVGQKITLPDISDVRPSGPVLVDVLEPVATSSGTDIDGTARTYRVQSGDSLYKISKKLFGTGKHSSEIYDLNKDLIGEDDSKLKLGMLLKLPEITPRNAVTAVQ